MLVIYNVLFIFCFLLASPVFLYKLLRHDKWREGLGMRFGFYPRHVKDPLQGKRNIWVHAASVGEVKAVLPLLRKIQERLPTHHIVLSTVTRTGNEIARKNVGSTSTVIYFPLDFIFSVRRAIEVIHPERVIFVESELWANCLAQLDRQKIPVALVNVRMSLRSFRRYRGMRFFTRLFLKRLLLVTAPTRREANKMKILGVPSQKIHVVGNLKFDNEEFCELSQGEKGKLLTDLGLSKEGLIIVGGSTHEGEEAVLADIYQGLSREIPNLFLVLAPRHPERAAYVVEQLEKRGMKYRLKTKANGSSPYNVLILDTIGELERIYSIGHIVFVGKSLTRKGGQNLLEPARCGKPIIFGPHMENFEDMAGIFVDEGAAIQVEDAISLRDVLKRLLESQTERELMGYRAKEILARNKGSVERTLWLLGEVFF